MTQVASLARSSIVPDFVKVAKVADLPDPGKRTLQVEDSVVVLIRVGDRYYCIDDVCTHDGGPLGEGRLDDHAIACPRHGAKFDIRTGRPLTMPATVSTLVHEVKVVGEDIFVRINEA
jgi:3-phenylpropionate/trans-cinnamate dioxygenase ferredoxin subunit